MQSTAGTGHASVHAPFDLCNGFSQSHRVLYEGLFNLYRSKHNMCDALKHTVGLAATGITSMSGAATIQLYIFEHFS